jgi:UDP-glucose 4-epimerase
MAKGKILVTGGLGYIGSHTCVELLQQDYDVVILDNLSNSKLLVKDRIEKLGKHSVKLFLTDVTGYEDVSSIFQNEKITGVIHFAAFKAVGESVEKPLTYYKNNVSGLINLLRCMEEHEVNSLVFSSSCTVYGQPENLPVSEDTAVMPPESPYGNTKKICEEIIADTSNVSSLKAINLRYFNPVGAHDSGLIGELPLGIPNNLVPFITQTAIGKRDQLTIFGDDYNTADGTCIRDYIHVVDLAKAHIKAIEYTQKMDVKVDYFNVGTGNGYSVKEVVEAFQRVNEVDLPHVYGKRRPGDIEQIWATTDKANNLLSWKAELGLDEMMSSAWNWEKSLK